MDEQWTGHLRVTELAKTRVRLDRKQIAEWVSKFNVCPKQTEIIVTVSTQSRLTHEEMADIADALASKG